MPCRKASPDRFSVDGFMGKSLPTPMLSFDMLPVSGRNSARGRDTNAYFSPRNASIVR